MLLQFLLINGWLLIPQVHARPWNGRLVMGPHARAQFALELVLLWSNHWTVVDVSIYTWFKMWICLSYCYNFSWGGCLNSCSVLQWFPNATSWKQKCSVQGIKCAPDLLVGNLLRQHLWTMMVSMTQSVRMMGSLKRSSVTTLKPAGASTVLVSAEVTKETRTSSVNLWRPSEYRVCFFLFPFFPHSLLVCCKRVLLYWCMLGK